VQRLSVSLEDEAARGRRDVTCSRGRAGCFAGGRFDARRFARALGFSEALAFELREQELDGALDHEGEIPLGIGVAREIQAPLELFAKRGARREFDAETFGRNGAYASGSVALRKARREQRFDLTLGLSADGVEKLDVILLREVRSQEGKCRQVHLPRSDERANDGKSSREPRCSEAAKCFAFAQSKFFDAEVEHRRKAGHDVQSPVLDFREIDDEPRGELAL
jgi:hypothetical protein